MPEDHEAPAGLVSSVSPESAASIISTTSAFTTRNSGYQIIRVRSGSSNPCWVSCSAWSGRTHATQLGSQECPVQELAVLPELANTRLWGAARGPAGPVSSDPHQDPRTSYSQLDPNRLPPDRHQWTWKSGTRILLQFRRHYSDGHLGCDGTPPPCSLKLLPPSFTVKLL